MFAKADRLTSYEDWLPTLLLFMINAQTWDPLQDLKVSDFDDLCLKQGVNRWRPSELIIIKDQKYLFYN